MKRTLIFLAVLGLTILKIHGQQIPGNEALLMDNFIDKILTIEKEKIESPDLVKVFTGNFYRITPTYYRPNGTSSCERYHVVIRDGVLFELEELDEDKTLELLFTLINPGFALRGQADADILELALDQIYPVDWSVSKEDKYHVLQDGQWLFLRGDFFENRKGFVISTDGNSRISHIDYKLAALPK